MGKITLSELAPAEAVHFSFAGVEFDLSGNKNFISEDDAVLSDAQAHPWLNVEFDEVEVVSGEYRNHLRPEDDGLSRSGRAINPNDPAEVFKVEQAKLGNTVEVMPVAIDAGKDQHDSVITGGFAETLAADPDSKTHDKVEGS